LSVVKYDQAAVLVSGGMDSIAALMWARHTYKNLLAVLFDYGQPNRDNELIAAGRTANELGIPRLLIAVADSLPRPILAAAGAIPAGPLPARGILRKVEDHDGRAEGLSPAFVPGRNIFFVTSAAAHAAVHFPNGNIDVVIGCNKQDAQRFPDCTMRAMLKLGEALRVAIAREIGVSTPWIDHTKAEILKALKPEDLPHVARSWSCYRNDGPCGTCSACVLRKEAFEAAGLEDQCKRAQMFGGDPARECK
jgi:7-cyano-7-deazaguanine synthase